MTEKGPRLALFAASLQSGNGGISRVARLMAKAVGRFAQQTGIDASAYALSDAEPYDDLLIATRVYKGSRLRFVGAALGASLGRTHFIYDSLGISRAHSRLPALRRPMLVYMHGIDVWEGTSRHRIAAARRADLLVSNSNYTKARADATFGNFARAQVCWLATESDDPAPPGHPDVPRVLVVSRVEESYKGHDALLDCWPSVVAAVPDARLTFVGSGPRLADLRRRAASSPAADRIDVLGFVPDDALEDLYARSTVFALPSRGEGFGLVYIEAMRHGLPVIASRHDAGQEINLDGQTGYNVDLDRPADLPLRLIELLNAPERAAAMGACGRQRWAAHFRYSAFEARFSIILRDFLDMENPR